MTVVTIDISVTPMSVQELLTFIENEATEILLTDGTNPLARLVPIRRQNNSRTAGLHPGAISITNDFDAPLPEKFWTS